MTEQQTNADSTQEQGLTRADGLLFVTVLFWGVNFPIVKYVLAEIPAFAFNALRFTIAAIVLSIALLFSRQDTKLSCRQIMQLVAIGLLGYVVYQVLFILGIDRTSASNPAIILATMPVWVAVIGSLAGVEEVRPLGWLGIALSLCGVVVMILAKTDAHFTFGGPTLGGDALILLGTLCWAGYTLLMRPMLKTCSAIQVTSVACLGALLPLLLLGAPSLLKLDWHAVPLGAWLAVGFSGLFSVGLGYIFWNHGVSRLGSTKASLYTNVTPAFALFTAWIWLGETLTVQQTLGIVLVLCGVTLARRFVAAK